VIWSIYGLCNNVIKITSPKIRHQNFPFSIPSLSKILVAFLIGTFASCQKRIDKSHNDTIMCMSHDYCRTLLQWLYKTNKLILFYSIVSSGWLLDSMTEKVPSQLLHRQQAVINSKLLSYSCLCLSCTSLLTILDALLYVFVFDCYVATKTKLETWFMTLASCSDSSK